MWGDGGLFLHCCWAAAYGWMMAATVQREEQLL